MKNIEDIKKDFPIFTAIPGFTYLDSTATSLKPHSVIDAVSDYYSSYSANIFRGVYDISEKATAAYEATRKTVQSFIGAHSESEIIFTRSATESINLFVNGIEERLSEGDEIITTLTEHHSNFVPWQQICIKKKMKFTAVSPDDAEQGIFPISKKTKVLALCYASNVLGTVHPVQKIIQAARSMNPQILILVDGAQAVPHLHINVVDLGCDALAFSSHKMLGPTGVGVLWVRKNILETLSPYQYGGDMIRSVTIEKTIFADVPHRFEAGTPHIAGVIALKSAIDYLEAIGLDAIHRQEIELAQLCTDRLKKDFSNIITVIGPEKRASGIVAFTVKDIHAHDVAQILNEDNIAVRAGHHCAMPLHSYLGIDASVRASFYLYNSEHDVEKLIASLKKIVHLFK